MLKDLKFTETELGDKDISSLPDRPGDAGITAEELKARFDMIPKTLLALGKFNQMIDTLTDIGGAENIGTAPIEGIEGENVQAALISMGTKTAEATAAAEAATQRATAAEAAATAAAESATKKAETAIMAAETATAKADAATAAAETAAAQGKEAAEAAKLATDTVTEVKEYSEQKAQEAKDYVDNAILQSGAVVSVFGRAGAITAEAGDYTAEQITYGEMTVAEGIAAATAAAAQAKEAAAEVKETAETKATASYFTVTLPSTDWTGDSAPYTQTATVEGILATDSPIVDILLTEESETAELEAWGYIGRIDTAADSITATCFEDKPSVDLNIQIKVVR